jgi:hypothetical protein
MRQQRKIIIAFAACGLAMAVAYYAYVSLVHYTDRMSSRDNFLNDLSLVLCPAQLVSGFFCIDCEATGYAGTIDYSIVGLLNTSLYALIGFIIVTLRKDPPDNTLRIDTR